MKIDYPADLPISGKRAEIVSAIKENSVVIISGSTGSGKTTQIPKMCLEAGFGKQKKIGCTQPRRVAAISVAQRISDELKVSYGSLVGSKIRFNDKTSKNTRIQVMTDGILLQEFQSDSKLSNYDVLIIDEAHERSLNIDFILGFLKNLIEERLDLKVVITSATIDTQKFSNAFSKAPIIEVSGTLYPIEVDYRPVDNERQDLGDKTYLDECVEAAESLIFKTQGDVLVFLPTEADIRETHNLMDGSFGNEVEILLLFGRLSNRDQQQIFHPGEKRRIVLTTNIAETSLTVPRIESVIDTGLARVSRYSHATGTLRLPIERISRSSADQRKGRCGRLGPGYCIRIYDEEDYLSRDEFTEPEIFRANLGAVILKLIDLKIPEIHQFPFVDPPKISAIRSSYKNLQAIGAIDLKNRITSLGKRLVRLPIDLSIGCMMLHAEKLGVFHEVAVIGAAMSIQDPRERPEDSKELADHEHIKFLHPESDFISLYNIWNSFHNDLDGMSQSKMRKFCKKHFLAYMRMREWMDLYKQIQWSFKKEKKKEPEESIDKKYDRIHQAILSGLILNVAQKVSGNIYRASGNREVSIFPGSGLYDRKAFKVEKKLERSRLEVSKDPNLGKTPDWIVAGNISETSRTFARCVGKIDPNWMVAIAPHLIRKSYVEPYWSEKKNRVLVLEKIRIFGLLIDVKKVGFGKVNPREAREIFIRSALVQFEVRDCLPILNVNRNLIELFEQNLSRNRNFASWHLHDKVFAFYDKIIPSISSLQELSKWLNSDLNRKKFRIQSRDLSEEDWALDEVQFPSKLKIGEKSFKIQYRYQPGSDLDGATLSIPIDAFLRINSQTADWIIPGFLSEKIEIWLRALPKEIRTRIFPIADAAEKVQSITFAGNYSLKESIFKSLKKIYKLNFKLEEFADPNFPPQLKLRFEVLDQNRKPIIAGRDYKLLEKKLLPEGSKSNQSIAHDLNIFKSRYEIPDLDRVGSYNLKEKIECGKISGIKSFLYVGISCEKCAFAARLYPSKKDADLSSFKSLEAFLRQKLCKDVAWLQKDLNETQKKCGLLFSNLGNVKDLEFDLLRMILLDARKTFRLHPMNSEEHNNYFEAIRKSWRGLVPRILDCIQSILNERQKLLLIRKSYDLMHRDVKVLLPSSFVKQTPLKQFFEIPRYLKAIEVRNHRFLANPNKDSDKNNRVQSFEEGFLKLLKMRSYSQHKISKMNEFFWILQEFKVSVFAPELKTAVRVSDKIVFQRFSELSE